MAGTAAGSAEHIEVEVADPFDLRTAALALHDLGGRRHADRPTVRVPTDGSASTLRAVLARLDHVGLGDARVDLRGAARPGPLARLRARLAASGRA